jgi:hypothetical protein
MFWSGRGDLNSRPPAPKAGALPGCATPRHEVRNDYKALPNRNLAPPVQFGRHGVNPYFETALLGTPPKCLPSEQADYLQPLGIILPSVLADRIQIKV